MESSITGISIADLSQIKEDIALIKDAVLPERELTDWVRKELAEAKKVPESECISHEEIEKEFT